jgi:hypothetical protein
MAEGRLTSLDGLPLVLTCRKHMALGAILALILPEVKWEHFSLCSELKCNSKPSRECPTGCWADSAPPGYPSHGKRLLLAD